jgi:hypothetical protein
LNPFTGCRSILGGMRKPAFAVSWSLRQRAHRQAGMLRFDFNAFSF